MASMTVGPAIANAPAAPGRQTGWAIAAVTGLAGILFALLAFRSVPTFEAEFGQLAQTEARGIAAWRAIVADARAGKLTDPAAADRIDRELLPIWQEARRQVARLESGPWADRLPKQLSDAFRLRQEAWEAMAAAARTGDRVEAQRSKAAWVEAERLVAEIRQGTGRQ